MSTVCIGDSHAHLSPNRARLGLLVFAAVVADDRSRVSDDVALERNLNRSRPDAAISRRAFEPEPRRAARTRALVARSLDPLCGEGDQSHVRSLEKERRKAMMNHHLPKGPDGAWKTGQRVPFSGYWADQHGDVTRFIAGRTFPPCIDRKGECAFRHLTDYVDLVDEAVGAA